MYPTLSFCLLTIFLFHLSFSSFMKHKYIIDIESGTLCSDNNKLEVPMRKFSVDRINRTHRAFNAEFTFAHPLDDTSEGSMIIDKWSSGKWVNFPFLPFTKDPCKCAMTISPPDIMSMFIDMEKAMGIKNPGKCPIAAGNYSMKNYAINLQLEMPFFNGRFRVMPIFRRIKNKQKIFCAVIIVTFSELTE